jgi:hypothetical protein
MERARSEREPVDVQPDVGGDELPVDRLDRDRRQEADDDLRLREEIGRDRNPLAGQHHDVVRSDSLNGADDFQGTGR